MESKLQTGIFGKLPLHGDFIYRNLPNDCMNSWDEWLQRYIGGSREELGNEWLDIYLTSPIWRFAMSEGVLDGSAWMGMMVPSVDRVGRYFPISVLSEIPPQVNLFEYMMLQTDWFEQVEQRIINALDAQLDVDELMTAVDEVELNQHTAYDNVQRLENHSSTVINMEFEEQSPTSVYPHFLDAFLSLSLASYSVWTTPGSERVEPCMSITQGLPKISGIASMLDGQWSYWNWQQPYKLRVSESRATNQNKTEQASPDSLGAEYKSSVVHASEIGAESLDDSPLIPEDVDFLDPEAADESANQTGFEIIDNQPPELIPSDFNDDEFDGLGDGLSGTVKSNFSSHDTNSAGFENSNFENSDFEIMDNEQSEPSKRDFDSFDSTSDEFEIVDNDQANVGESDFISSSKDDLSDRKSDDGFDLSDLNIVDNDNPDKN